MSKKLVAKAIELAGSGKVNAAVECLQGINRTYVAKRLTAYLATDQEMLRNVVVELADAAGISLGAPSGSAPKDVMGKAITWRVSDAETLRKDIDPEALSSLAAPSVNQLASEVCLDISSAPILEPFALAGLGARALRLRESGLRTTISSRFDNPSNKFANALGLNAMWAGVPPAKATEEERTIAIKVVKDYGEMEKFSQEVATRVCPEDQETRSATKYCLIELIRNVLDHSGASATVCAQYMYAGKGSRTHDGVQVAVADCGVGLRSTLVGMHEWVLSDSIAMTAALSPFVSRTFPEGDFGQMKDNAGLGLYFT